jgi:hypothetical protein
MISSYGKTALKSTAITNFFSPYDALVFLMSYSRIGQLFLSAGHISVKKTKSKLKKLAFAGRMLPPPELLPKSYKRIFKIEINFALVSRLP